MHTNESAEMYLETILELKNEHGEVRSIDIARKTGYSKPSVSRAIGLLRRAGYVVADKDGYLTLTDVGEEVAKKIFERHTLITDFLIRLGVDKETASEDACRIEHHISDASIEAIKKHINKYKD